MDKVIQLDSIRIDRQKPRKCTCDERDKKFTVDTVNREVICECGIVTDPFEAILNFATHYERINENHIRLDKQRKQWLKEKPWSVLFKKLEKHYRKGKMLPFCPSCNELIELSELKRWGSAEFYRRRKGKG